MRLHDYFNTVQSYRLSEKEKNALYERILRNTQPATPIFSRARFYMKVAGYMTFLGILGLSIYLPFLSQQNGLNVPTAGTVSAGYIAKVVNVNWDYHIESDGKRIDGSNINDGDTIILAKDSSLVVQVGDRVEGKISGPATFVVKRKDSGYEITLKQGDYMEFATLWDQSQSPEVSLISEPHKFTARTKAGKWFHFVLTEENEKPLLVNKSNEEISVVEQENPEKTILLAENKSIEVGTFIFATTATPNEVADMIAKTSTSENSPVLTPKDQDYNDSFFRDLLLADMEMDVNPETATTTSKSANEAGATTMAVSSEGTKQAQTNTYNREEVRSNLIPQFVWVDIKYVTYYYLNGQQHEFEVAYENFLKRMYNLYDALGVNIPSGGVMSSQKDSYSLAKLRILAEHLQNNLPADIPQHQLKTMRTLVTCIQRLSQQKFAAYKDQKLSLEQMFDKIQ